MTQNTAIVTGAGSGIGRSVALKLLDNGYQVVLAGRREEALQETLKLSGEHAKAGISVPTDVREAAQVDNLFERCVDSFGRVDVLFNNAGVGAPDVDIDELDVESWQRVADTNISGAFLCARAAFAAMKKQVPQGGRIINNGSISAHLPRPNSTPYTMSKHAISGLTKCLALDGRRYDIACGQIDIGNARTELAQRLGEGTLQANGGIMAEPLMDVQHVADAVLNMAQLPLDTNILFMTIMATKMPFVGRG
ncbi:MAG: SDR family oxidoreductase [Gammaproteobacteria bacterium]|nr:SDR family oxidoreductase [Gammaproteobacteria bacterium]